MRKGRKEDCSVVLLFVEERLLQRIIRGSYDLLEGGGGDLAILGMQ
jgi:hypothetical protein